MSSRAVLLAVLAAAAMLALGAAPAGALATYVADPALDGDDTFAGDGQCIDNADPAHPRCSLRAAIEESNALPLRQRIDLLATTYRPATPLPAITADLDLVGAGARATTIDAGGHGRALTTSGGDVTVSDLTLTGGVLDAGYGAGVRNAGADLTLARVAVVGNLSRANLSARGGGIDNASGSMVVYASLVAGNRAEPRGPSADGDAFGGGISSDAPLTIVETTVHGNVARPQQSGVTDRAAYGGGVAISAGVSELRHVTFSDNLADGGGAGGNLYIQGANPVTMRDSVLVGGSDGNGPENCGGQKPGTLPFNVESGTTCGLAAGGFPSTDPLLAPFGSYGGPSDSRPPLQGSILPGLAMDCSAGADQRGTALGAACDVGAVERSTDAAASIAASRSPVPAGGELTLTLTAASGGLDSVLATTALLSLPAGATFVGASSPGGTCATRGDPSAPTSVVCTLGPPVLGQVLTATVRAPASGALTFTGTVSGDIGESGLANDSATITVPVLAAPAPRTPAKTTGASACKKTRRGTSRGERIVGTSSSERILGGRGNDRIEGRGGDDCLYGQDGRDTISGGEGRDTIGGGTGNDTIKARDGKRDTITCGKGRDNVTGDHFDRIAKDCETKRLK